MDNMTEKEKLALKLDEEENEILNAFEKGNLKYIVLNEKERKVIKASAEKK